MSIDEETILYQYWRFKGYGRLLLLIGIAMYGVGLLLNRARREKLEADDDEISRFI